MTVRIFKRLLCVAILSCVAMVMCAQDGGTSVYSFMNISSSSRIYGLGGINISMVDGDDVMTTEQNPALLGAEMSRSIGVSYMRYIGGSNFAGAKYAHSAGENGAWSIGLHYFGYGSIKSALADGTITGTFSPMDLSIAAQYSHNIGERWRGGITLNFIYNNYGSYTAMAVATDLGVNYYDDELDSSWSLVIANLGGQVKKFNETGERLPIDIRTGWSKALGSSPLILNITAWNLTKWHLPYWKHDSQNNESKKVDTFAGNLFRHLIFGIEWQPSDRFYVDLAYNYKTATDMSTYSRNFLSGFSIGAGLKVRAFGVGVSFAQPHKSAATFMVNLTTNLYEF